MDLLVHEVIERVQKAKTKKEKINILKEHETWALKDILMGTFDTSINWNIPSGAPPYKPALPESVPSNLISRNKDFRYFVEGGPGSKMPAFKRENIFIGLIEAIHPKDAELVIAMINKKKPTGITRKIVTEAFPDLLED